MLLLLALSAGAYYVAGWVGVALVIATWFLHDVYLGYFLTRGNYRPGIFGPRWF